MSLSYIRLRGDDYLHPSFFSKIMPGQMPVILAKKRAMAGIYITQ